MAVDVFASPVSANLREHQHSTSVILLFIQSDVAVYGTETNNGLKIVIGVGEEVPVDKLEPLFSLIHKNYLRATCNPFTDLSQSEESILLGPRFENRISDLVASWSG